MYNIDVSVWLCYNNANTLEIGEVMPVSEAHKRASRKYNEKAYDRIELKVRKGEKANLQTHAESRGESLNGFVNRAIKETIERDNSMD